MLKEARFYKLIKDNKAECLLCPHRCVIPENALGRCKARRLKNGVLYAENYGKLSAIADDPIEKKPYITFIRPREYSR